MDPYQKQRKKKVKHICMAKLKKRGKKLKHKFPIPQLKKKKHNENI
jgi:hypothetical protein